MYNHIGRVYKDLEPDANSTDEELLLRVRAGDEKALPMLVSRYEKLVAYFSKAYFRLSGVEQEDLIQEGMLGLVRAFNGYDPQKDASFNTYASVCIRNALTSAARKSLSGDGRLSVLYMEDLGELADVSVAEQIQSDTVDQKGYLEDIICLLSGFERNVLKLYMSGLNRKEISESLNRSYKSVDNALVRIKNKAKNKSRAAITG
jgi:RNA polymerase sporulation-specific sigma factor